MNPQSLRELLDHLVVASIDAPVQPDRPIAASADETLDWSDGNDQRTVAFDDADSPEAVPLHLPPPDGLARYRLLKLLGRGGMGEVWRVYDHILDRTVALKFLHAHLAHNPAASERFLQEARAGAALQHPNVIPLYEVGRLADGRPFFTTREVHGSTLSDRLRHDHTTLRFAPPTFHRAHATIGELLRIFLRICETVAYAHSVGFVHRDLKPDNVMVGAFGEVLVLDWGLSKRVGEEESPSDTLPGARYEATRSVYGMAKGTPVYMPPEQIVGDGTDGPASDVYALGGLLFELLTGTVPYAEWSIPELLAHKTQPEATLSPPPQVYGIDIRALGDVIAASVSHDAQSRPSLDALAASVREWLVGSDRAVRARQASLRAERQLALRREISAKIIDQRREAQRQLASGAGFAHAWTLWQATAGLKDELQATSKGHRQALREALTHDPTVRTHREVLAWHEAQEALSAWLASDSATESGHLRSLEAHLRELAPETARHIRDAALRWREDGLMARLRRCSPFVPADGVMEQLDSLLTPEGARVCLLGAPGVGRRRLALELARARSLAGQVVVVLDCDEGETLRQLRRRLRHRLPEHSPDHAPQLLVLLGTPGCEPLFADLQHTFQTRRALRMVFAGMRSAIPGAASMVVPSLPTLVATQLFVQRALQNNRPIPTDPRALQQLESVVAMTGGLPVLVELAADQLLTASLEELANSLSGDSSAILSATVVRGETSRLARIRWRSLPQAAKATLLQLSVVRGDLSMDCIRTIVRTDADAPSEPAEVLEQLTSWFLLEREVSRERFLVYRLSPAGRLLAAASAELDPGAHQQTLLEARRRLSDFLWSSIMEADNRLEPTTELSTDAVENLCSIVTHGRPDQAAATARKICQSLVLSGAYPRATAILHGVLAREDLHEVDRRRLLLQLSGILAEQGQAGEAMLQLEQAQRSGTEPPADERTRAPPPPSVPADEAPPFTESPLHTLLRRSQTEAAVTHLRLELSRVSADAPPAERVPLLLDLARALAATGDHDAARQALAEATAQGGNALHDRSRAVITLQTAWLAVREGRMEDAVPDFEAVLQDRAPDFDRNLSVWALEGLARSLRHTDPARATTLRREGLLHVLAGFGGFDAQRLSANLGNDLYEDGKVRDAYVVLRESLERFRGHLEGLAVALIYDNLTWICMELGRWDEAEEASRRSLSSLYDDQLGYRAYLARTRATVLALIGRDVQTRRILAEHPLGVRGNRMVQTVSEYLHGVVHWLLGEPAVLREHLATVPAAHREEPSIRRWLVLAERLVHEGALLGPNLRELRCTETHRDAAPTPVRDDLSVEGMRWFQLAENHRLDGQKDKAYAAFLQARIRALAVGDRFLLARTEHALGMVAGSDEAFLQHLHRSQDLYVELGYPDRAMGPRSLLATRFADLGRVGEAERIFRELVAESGPSENAPNRAFVSRRNTHIHLQLQLGMDVLTRAEEVADLVSRTDMMKHHGIALANVGLALWVAGREEEAEARLREGLDCFHTDGLKALRWELQLLLARVCRARGRLVEATIAAQRMEELSTGQGRQQLLQEAVMAAIRTRRGEADAGKIWLAQRPALDALTLADAAIVLACWIEMAASVGAWEQLRNAMAAESAIWCDTDISPRSPDRLLIEAVREEARSCARAAGVSLSAEDDSSMGVPA